MERSTVIEKLVKVGDGFSAFSLQLKARPPRNALFPDDSVLSLLLCVPSVYLFDVRFQSSFIAGGEGKTIMSFCFKFCVGDCR